MAVKKQKEKEYISVGKTTIIAASSRCSVKIRDNYYTVEYHEERAIPCDIEGVNIKQERIDLWNTVNNECDTQIEEVIKTFQK